MNKEKIDLILSFFNHPFFIFVGGVTVIFGTFGVFRQLFCWLLGISPIAIRLGVALSKRRVAIFGSPQAFESLKSSLVDSGIFKEKNVICIHADNFEKAQLETVYLVDWESFGEKIEQIFLLRKSHQIALIIYAKPGSIPQDQMNIIANRPNTVVVNFRGRLLNDILTSMMTTAYEP